MGIIGRIIASGMLVWALADHAYGYFTLLRFVVCLVAAYNSFVAYSLKKEEWTWILGGIAILFNPIMPFHLNRHLWTVVDIAVAAVLVISLFFVKGKRIRTKVSQ